ncbi:DNA-binding GntR family transcriptional regulator [Amycolatopsis bartoniae]|uniref:GntR family transcriptional regulator n=1 Tax=Amycolatopsis bartoniae TaxID=941986 RepID=A0A8H9MB42_9PSEU|nr:GntR family transcriptional regulator [Amycolatopsis bartoniae]MBB2935810.1 DNA-binding GntR family transcriptional regulator [Amycolatopsis bartoniae]TVT00271.1 GntR family transcriptional regulator [Amycolatopsis bartoniae]GHF62013.1 GntR family transcriptional regulator [Amycolatopsis bartoniae]
MQPAQRRGLADEAADRIREEILEGRIEPGSPLREVELAELLQVSRGSVREGLAVLEREGLVQSVWHKGTHVIGLTVADVEEVYAVRAALDRLAAVTAAVRATAEQLDELDRLVARMAREIDARQVLALDLEFHELIYQAAANRRLLDAWRAVRWQVHLFQSHRIRLGRDRYRAAAWGEHKRLATLIRSGDVGPLADAAEEHAHSARRALIEKLTGPPKR